MKKIIKYLIVIFLLSVNIPFLINYYVVISTKNQIVDMQIDALTNDYDCILVLGASAKNNRPSVMLKDRLDVGIMLYQNNYAKRLLMSGDHGRKNYDEVNVMKKYAIEHDIASNVIFMDHAGFSTYDSIYRAKYIFGVKKMIIVSQQYHLYRALYIANALGIEAVGVSATLQPYTFQTKRDVREVLARNKDFVLSFIKPQSTYLGDTIPIFGDGDYTNDPNTEIIMGVN